MGGIWKLIPWTYALMWIGSLALGGLGIPGVFGVAGFYSKDHILESAFAAHSGVGMFAFWLGVGAALMTAFYSWRLLLMTFHGETRADHETYHHVHESPWVMLVPLIVLAAGAVLSGFVYYDSFVGEHMEAFWNGSIFFAPTNEVPHHAHEVPLWVKLAPLVVGLGGIAIAYLFYMFKTDLPGKTARAFAPLYQFFLNKWYFDELYEAIFVEPAKKLGFGLWKGGDGAIIDGLGPDGIASVSQDVAKQATRLQSGYVYHYAFAMLIGVVLLVTWYMFGSGW
jgi:NADH-quinone oxidoreductase subunit L